MWQPRLVFFFFFLLVVWYRSVFTFLQNLSESVANALAFYGDRETKRFVRFFDCLNGMSTEKDENPYYSEDDERPSVTPWEPFRYSVTH